MTALQLVLILGPPFTLLVVRFTSLRRLSRPAHYLLFVVFGVAHGLFLYAGLVYSEWRTPDLSDFSVLFLSSVSISFVFGAVYAGLGLLVDLSVRLLARRS